MASGFDLGNGGREMNYKPKTLDIDAMDEMFNEVSKYQQEAYNTEFIKSQAYNSGFQEAVSRCRDSLTCSNYEIKTPDSKEIVKSAYCQICKELKVDGGDIYTTDLSLDEMAANLAHRILETLENDLPRASAKF
jgi:putative component of membrane protein insertase Oxa1/YidC/SpoIIIJ protein YidD